MRFVPPSLMIMVLPLFMAPGQSVQSQPVVNQGDSVSTGIIKPGEPIAPPPLFDIEELTGEPAELTLREVVLTTLAQNLDVKVAEKGRDISAQESWGAYGIYDPVLGASVERIRVDQQQGIRTEDDEQAVTYTDTTRTEASVSQLTPLGTQVTAFAADARERDREPFTFGFSDALINPSYSSTAGVRVEQPLLKNFGPLVTNAEIRINKRELARSNLRFREVIQERIAAVMKSYWDLDFALRNLFVQHRSLASAEELLRVNQRRYDVGDAAYLSVVQADAQVAEREFLIAAASAQVVDAQDRLLALMNWAGGAENLDAWERPIRPVDQPAYNPYLEMDDKRLVNVALDSRPEFLQDKVAYEIAEINRDVSRRQRLPELNAFAGYNVSGLEDQRSESYDTLRTGDYAGYNFGVEFRYPLFNRRARAQYQAALDRVEQAELSIESRELVIIREVRAALRAYRTAISQIESTTREVIANEEKVRAERKRLEVGEGTIFDVLDFEDDLALSRANQARALANYQIALIEIARASGILLDVQGIIVDDQDSPDAMDLFIYVEEEDPVSVTDADQWIEMLHTLQNVE